MPVYNKKRKKDFPKFVIFVIIWIVSLTIMSMFLFGVIFDKINLLMVGLWLLIVDAVCLLALSYLSESDKIYNNRGGYTVKIKIDLEKQLKEKFINRFLSIFLSKYSYHNAVGYLYGEKYRNIYKIIREQTILNPSPAMGFDDLIEGLYGNIKIKIYESDTRIFRISIILTVLFFIVVFSFMFFLIFHNVILLFKILLILPIIFIKKIYEYSPFRGVIIEFEMNKNFKGHTFLHDNSFTAKKIPFDKKKYQKVNLESMSFEKKYNVYSDDQIEARYLLTTSFIERIENLNKIFKGKYLRGSFKDNKLIIAIHTGKDMFAMGSNHKDSDVHTFEILFDEMISVLQIADELKLNQRIGL